MQNTYIFINMFTICLWYMRAHISYVKYPFYILSVRQASYITIGNIYMYIYIYIYIHRFVSFCIHCWCKHEIKFRPAIFALIYRCTKSITTLRTNKNRAKSHISTICDSKLVQNQNRIESQICTLQEHQRIKVSITLCDLFSIYMILAKLHQN